MLHSAKAGDATVAVENSKDNGRPKSAKEEGVHVNVFKRSELNVVESLVKAAVAFDCDDTDHFAEECPTAEPHLKQQPTTLATQHLKHPPGGPQTTETDKLNTETADPLI